MAARGAAEERTEYNNEKQIPVHNKLLFMLVWFDREFFSGQSYPYKGLLRFSFVENVNCLWMVTASGE
jgi:hypothetical protein